MSDVYELVIFKIPKGAYIRGCYTPWQLINLMIHIGITSHHSIISLPDSESELQIL